jgi:hypothetical protein
MCKYITAITFILTLTATIVFFGCGEQPEVKTGDIAANITSAMAQLTTYQLDTLLTENYTVERADSSHSDTWDWQGKLLVDLTNNATMLSMNVTEKFVATTPYIWQVYAFEGWLYRNQISPPVYGPHGQIKWTKTKPGNRRINYLDLASNAYISPQIELLQTAREVTTAGTENIDGVDCFILEVVPNPQAAADWVLAQQLGNGPSLYWWWTDFTRSEEIYTKAYQGGLDKLWIDKTSFRIIKTDIDLHFIVKAEDIKQEDTGGLSVSGSEYDVGFNSIIIDFHGELQFSNYGQSLSIVPPAEALNAKED